MGMKIMLMVLAIGLMLMGCVYERTAFVVTKSIKQTDIIKCPTLKHNFTFKQLINQSNETIQKFIDDNCIVVFNTNVEQEMIMP